MTSLNEMDYRTYKMSAVETALTVGLAMSAAFLAAFVFYHSILISAIAAPLGLLYLPLRRKAKAEKRREALKAQFRDMLYSLSSSLQSGKPLEAAIRDARDDLKIQYPDPDTAILLELDVILRKAALNEPVESALKDLADRSGVDDIASFSAVIHTCKRTGGDLVEVVRNTTNILGDKQEIRNEIDLLLAQRKLERRILNVMPFGMTLILTFSAGEFIEPVFTTVSGRLAMTAAVALMAISWAVSAKITKIDA